MNDSRLAILATLTALSLLLPAVAGARNLPDQGMLLEPGPDGSYALPLPGQEGLVPLELDPGEAPVRLVRLSFEPERGVLRVTLRFAGETPATAWSLELTAYSGAGEPLGASVRTEDWAASAPAQPRRSRAPGLAEQVHEGGLLRAGQTRRGELGVVLPAAEDAPPPDRFVLSVPVVVFADTSFTGSARLAGEILGARKAAAEELAYWTVRIEEAVGGVASDEEALAALAALRRDLDEGAAALPFSAQAVRANLKSNLDSVAAEAERRPTSAPAELRSLSEWFRSELDERSKHVPRELPDPPGPPSASIRIDERSHSEGDSEDQNCECGGSIFTSVSQFQSRICDGSATGWRVDETWSYSCRSEDGMSLGAGSGSLNGYGGCIESSFCFPDTYCPPLFSPSSETEDFDFHIWSRSVLNQKLLVGFCTARCSTDLSSSLTFKCPCSPRRAPGCTIDGCPLLIATGAGGFRLTDLDGGVRFDIDADGEHERVSWPDAGTDNAWLVLDRNGNGTIDDGSELFGDSTPQPLSEEPNGFLALAVFDQPEHGGNGDGVISAADAVFTQLQLWFDRNHDGISDPDELIGLAEAGIAAIELDYHTSHRRDRHGNQFRYSALVWLDSGGRRVVTDVFLLTE
ncbi:MAG TPA: hypothetical protein VM599_06560 [Thermoanaerobaculia bacterium]|nr:hypothetical protein [Thermoanaerobaculia bacterium]